MFMGKVLKRERKLYDIGKRRIVGTTLQVGKSEWALVQSGRTDFR